MDSVTGRLQERLSGVRLVKTYCRERDETNEFLASTDRALEYGLRTQMLSVSLNATSRIIGGIGSTLVFSLSAAFILLRDYSMRMLGHYTTYGDMVMVDNYLWMATWPAINLTTIAGQITQALVSLDRLIKLNIENLDVIDKVDAYDLPEVTGDISIESIDFSYSGKEKLFDKFSMHIPAGKMTALVGHTGCGKTTITSLILRMWDIQYGAIKIDGHDIRDITLRSLRRHTGVVPQEPVVFEGTIFDNISYAVPEATIEMVIEAAIAAQIHDYIISLPEGYHTILGKEGAKLSVGQKQRIAIARAILCKPTILILDEATSSLDSESEFAMQIAMKKILHGRTSVVVAHRLSTIVEADQIIVMDAGKICEIGTHDELMMIEDGAYRKLYNELKGKEESVNGN
jgi:ABC-type multidrug transport system fused ATPase/permease subunit